MSNSLFEESAEQFITKLAMAQTYWTYADIARTLQISERTLFLWRQEGRIPAPLSFGSAVRFTSDQVGQIMSGRFPKGTFPVEVSMRAKLGKKGAIKKKKLSRDRVYQARKRQQKKGVIIHAMR